jgi:hypothetical protein
MCLFWKHICRLHCCMRDNRIKYPFLLPSFEIITLNYAQRKFRMTKAYKIQKHNMISRINIIYTHIYEFITAERLFTKL